MHMLTDMHRPQTKDNFCDKHGKTQISVIVTDYIQHRDYVSNRDRMANSYSISQRMQKWTKKKFHLLDLTILNSCIIAILQQYSRPQKITKIWWKWAHRNLILRPPRGRPNPQTSQMMQHEGQQFKHWAVTGLCLQCCVHNQTQTYNYKISVHKI
jgi:hypothetical protein